MKIIVGICLSFIAFPGLLSAQVSSQQYIDSGVNKKIKGDLKGAIEDYNQALQLDPSNPIIHFELGLVEEDLNDESASIKEFSKAVQLKPDFADAYSSRGRAEQIKGDTADALTDYDKSIELDPHKFMPYQGRGNIKELKGDLDGAIAEFDKCIQLNPNNATGYYCRANAELKKNNLDGALADYTKAIQLDPYYADAYSNRAITDKALGNLSASYADFNVAMKLKHAQPTGNYSDRVQLSGTGFFVTSTGYILTDYHVVKGAANIEIVTSIGSGGVKLVASDPANDIAILKAQGTFSCLALSDSDQASLGQSVFTVGFPNTSVQGFRPKVTRGEISSLAGMQDDPRMFQISVPVQPGNSGGCLADDNGNVIGLIEAQLNAVLMANVTGDVPQNVNYATKISYAKALLNTLPDVKDNLATAKHSHSPFVEQVHNVQEATVLVISHSQ